MKTTLNLFLSGMMFVFLSGSSEAQEKSITKKEVQPDFKGKIAKTYEESEEWWPIITQHSQKRSPC